MPTSSQHRGRARSNREFLDSFDWVARPDWAVVVAFYTALHLVEQLRAVEGGHSRHHGDRLEYTMRHHRTIHKPFHDLHDAAVVARYESNKDFFAQFDPNVLAGNIGQWLTAVETYVDGVAPGRPPAAGP